MTRRLSGRAWSRPGDRAMTQRHQDRSTPRCADSTVQVFSIASFADRVPTGRARGHMVCVIALVVSLQLFGSAGARQQDGSAPEFTPMSDELVRALRRGGIRAAVRLVGHYVGPISIEDEEGIAPDAESLCRYSELVVLAQAIGRSPGALWDSDSVESFITTDYAMVVDESLHGHRAAGDSITVAMAGGFVQFPDGTTARERSRRGLPEIQIGSRYVWFLKRDEKRPDIYRPSSTEQGVFRVDGGRVFSRGRAVDEVFKKYNGMKADDFLSLVRSACK
jgi:hypothetical protein